MAGILDFAQYLGGPDSLQTESIFPSDQKTLVYNFGQNITGWTISAQYQTLVVDQVQFNRSTGKPNFGASTVIGSFARSTVSGASAPSIVDAAAGLVKIYIPANMYTGPIIPDARVNVPVTVYSVTWSDTSSPAQTHTNRFAFVQCWQPGVTVGDPKTANGYTALALS
jgi:hypothetical protein